MFVFWSFEYVVEVLVIVFVDFVVDVWEGCFQFDVFVVGYFFFQYVEGEIEDVLMCEFFVVNYVGWYIVFVLGDLVGCYCEGQYGCYVCVVY